MDYVAEIIKTVLTVGLGIIAFYFKTEADRTAAKEKELEGSIKEVHSKLDNDIKEVHHRLHEFKRDAQKEFTTKDEFIRSISNLDKKLDKIMDEIIKIKK